MAHRFFRLRRSSWILTTLLLAAPAAALDGIRVGAQELEPVEPWTSDVDLRDLPAPPDWLPGDPIKIIPRRLDPKSPTSGLVQPPKPALARDPLALPQAPAALADRSFAEPIHTFDGQGFSGVYPADPVGEAGPSFYVQMINGSTGTRTAFYDKATGELVVSFLLQDLAPPGSACRNGLGDPIALYDHLAGRWFLSEFASDPPNALCLYVARTNDPISGGWFHYQINTATFPDYPKYAVWPDAYYLNTNEGSLSVYALDRESMLQGLTLRPTQKFVAPDLSFWLFQTLPPVDLDGPPPPAGTPAYFVRQRDTELHNPTAPNPTQDFVELWPFHVDWENAANSSFGPAISIPTSEFNSLLCDPVTFSCIPQLGGRPLDPLREAVMWKPQYRNFGAHESIVGNFVVSLDAPNHAGVRWFELRRVGSGPWTLHQEGTWAGPLGLADPTSRWMAGTGMDKQGNLGLAYDVSSPALFPGIRYTGRANVDPLGTMTQGDLTIVEGSGPSIPFERWGDYNSLNVDTENDCVFWFTSMYGATLTGDWGTRVGAFKFDDCVVAEVNAPPVARPDTASTTPGVAITIDVLADNGAGADFDSDGDALAVIAVGDPPNGSTEHLGGGSVRYTPDSGFHGDDAFTYELSDGRGGAAIGSVAIAVSCPATPEPGFADDFEPAPEPGWSVDTAANALPVSPTWSAGPDLFAQSPTTSFSSDATTLDVKDDRLVSPALELTAVTHLSFWHRFDFEAGFDGGVLEVSTEGGASWVDAVAGGGEFLAGGYNGVLSADDGSPIPGRAAWTGSSGDPNVMQRVEIDLGAFAGTAVRLRWRLAGDVLVPGSLPGLGWWIDDVALVDWVEDCPFPPQANDDAATTRRDTPVVIDLLANDLDPDGDALTVTELTDPAHGAVTDHGDGTVTYAPDAGFVGTDGFEYTVDDGNGGSDQAAVAVTVEDDPASLPTKVNASGSIATGGGEATFHLNANAEESAPKGRLRYDATAAGGTKLKGTVVTISFASATTATLRGSCALGDGAACSFEVIVEDLAQPGTGADRFGIRVLDAGGNEVHAAVGALTGGNIQIR